MHKSRLSLFFYLGGVIGLAAAPAFAEQPSPLRGLWVGQARLAYVTEVTIPLDEDNVPIAPDPEVPTPTADEAQVRLILHVNGSGQASLLKDVAVLNRGGASDPTGVSQGGPLARESDLALVTDERLYGEFPPQPARRIASAVLDFGDHRASAAVDEVVARAAAAAAAAIAAETDIALGTTDGRSTAKDTAELAAQTAADPVLTEADAAAAFDAFVYGSAFKAAAVTTIATDPDPDTAAAAARTAAADLQADSFFGDMRAVDMVEAVVDAALAVAPEERDAAAQNTAAAYADTEDGYHRFIAGQGFGDLIAGAASAAASAAVVEGASEETLQIAVDGNAAVVAGRSEALTLRVESPYEDSRAQLAIDQVLAAVLGSAAEALPAAVGDQATVEEAALEAGLDALANTVARYAVPSSGPSPEYTEFVRSTGVTGFQESVDIASEAAAQAALDERVNNALYTAASLEDAARLGAVRALQAVYGAAARAVRTALPLAGGFGPGSGDPRLRWEIAESGGTPLGAPGLTGELVLPANAPTNPFRHRRHPDHTAGFDITRRLQFDFDGAPEDPLSSAGFGVDRVTGVFREEIFGLHKPLGPQRDTGLRVEGRFELQRISLIDALNAR